jgi:ComEC/Rec2-related protein
MKRLKTILASDAGYFIHPAIVLVLGLLSLNHLLAAILLCAELLWLWTRLRRLFVVSLVVTALAIVTLFFRFSRFGLGPATVFSGTVIDIEADTFLLKSGNRSILVFHDGETILRPGDEVTITGEVFAQTGYRIEHRFDYGAYLRAEGIDGTFYADAIVWNGHHFQLNILKTEVTRYLLCAFPETSAGMIVYVLLGNDGYLASGVTDSVQTLGISHLFAISGMNIAMIVGFLDAILKKLFLPKRIKEGIIVALLGIYTVLTGFSVSVVRAVLIVLCVYVKEWGKLPFSKLDLMSFTLMGSLLFNPFLIRSLSFQLSFLIAFAIVIGKDLLKTESPLSSVLKIGLYANLIALPILLEVNKEFNLLSIPSNLFFVLFVEKVLFPATFLTVAIPPFAPLYTILVGWFSGGVAFLAGFDTAIAFNFPSDLSKILYSVLILVLLMRIERKRCRNIRPDRFRPVFAIGTRSFGRESIRRWPRRCHLYS